MKARKPATVDSVIRLEWEPMDNCYMCRVFGYRFYVGVHKTDGWMLMVNPEDLNINQITPYTQAHLGDNRTSVQSVFDNAGLEIERFVKRVIDSVPKLVEENQIAQEALERIRTQHRRQMYLLMPVRDIDMEC